MKVVHSDDLKGPRATRVRLFLREVRGPQMRLDELHTMAEVAERRLVPYWLWALAKLDEFGETRGEDRTEAKIAEFKDKSKKQAQLLYKCTEADMPLEKAKEEVEFAEE